MRRRLDCLFLHAGAKADRGGIFGIIPAGLPPLAALMERSGFGARILNLACLGPGDPSLAVAVKELRPRLFCLTLHWHVQAAQTLRLAARLKRDHPGVPVILGGLTATFFAREILLGYRCVDYIVRGDAEGALPQLARALLITGRGPGRVPNVAWRRGGRPALNRITLGTPPESVPAHEGQDLILNRAPWPATGHCFEEGAFTYVHAHGCSENCAVCGGGRDFNRRFAGRPRPEIKSPRTAAAELGSLMSAGVRDFYFPATPLPGDGFFLSLLAELKKKGLAPGLRLDFCGGLPGRRLLRALAALSPRPEISVFCGSGSEKIRRLNRGRFYSNRDLLQALRDCVELDIKARVCFSAGFPGESPADVEETAALMRAVNDAAGRNAANVYLFPVEPGSPVYLRPARFGVRLRRRGLRGFVGQRSRYDPGYATSLMSEKEIILAVRRLEKERRRP